METDISEERGLVCDAMCELTHTSAPLPTHPTLPTLGSTLDNITVKELLVKD